MGGGATWRYTLNHPDRVVAMILVASVGLSSGKTDQQDRDRSTGDTPIGFYLLGQPGSERTHLDPELLVEQGLMAAYNNSPVVDQRLVDRYYELIMRKEPARPYFGGAGHQELAINKSLILAN